MIGVVCPESQRDFVIEFFEFFKTPWEFYRSERSYDVVLATEVPPRGVEAKLLVTYGLAGDVKRITSNSDQSREAYVEYDDTIFPVYGRLALIDSQGPVLLRLRGSGGTVAVDETSHRMRVIRVGFDLFEADWLFQISYRNQIDARPVAFFGRCVNVKFFFHARDSNDLFFADAVIKENEVAAFHRAQIVSRLKIPHAGPRGFAVLHQIRPRIRFGFRFHEPVVHRNIYDLRFTRPP